MISYIEPLSDDVVLSVRGVSKKFCRNLRRSMWYGIRDLSRNLLGVSGKREVAGGNTEEACGKRQEERCDVPLPLTSSPLPQAPLRRDEFWALRNVSFDLRRGECLGLIGRNGCGKTTLLRLIAGIFPPDQGEISIRGRVGALIALGAGFHPHMTGRENVYLNGAILGLHRHEIDAQFEEIVGFAEIGEFIDAPVSTYSSGMRVRLGFAVATALHPDLLLVDEVLAVGDAAFRLKCFCRISELTKKIAVIIVSHQAEALGNFCSSGYVMDGGVIVCKNKIESALEYYHSLIASKKTVLPPTNFVAPSLKLASLQIDNCQVKYGDSLSLAIIIQPHANLCGQRVRVKFLDWSGQTVAELNSPIGIPIVDIPACGGKILITIPVISLKPADYYICIAIHGGAKSEFHFVNENNFKITVAGPDSSRTVPYQLLGNLALLKNEAECHCLHRANSEPTM